jgi:hypothetical protein
MVKQRNVYLNSRPTPMMATAFFAFVTSGAGIAYPSEPPEFTPGL